MFHIYVAKAIEFFGLTYTRPIYERAIEILPDRQAKEMAKQYAELELKLGEIDRARAIHAHAAQFSDPRVDFDFWSMWHDFEVRHGNEDTFKEMLRIKRSVQAKFNTEVANLSSQILAGRHPPASAGEGEEENLATASNYSIVVPPSMSFVPGGTTLNGKAVENLPLNNPDEIALDDMDNDQTMEEIIPRSLPPGILLKSGL